jgi:hypothetical protein
MVSAHDRHDLDCICDLLSREHLLSRLHLLSALCYSLLSALCRASDPAEESGDCVSSAAPDDLSTEEAGVGGRVHRSDRSGHYFTQIIN